MLDFMATADEEQNFECKMSELRGKMSVSTGHGVASGGSSASGALLSHLPTSCSQEQVEIEIKEVKRKRHSS